MAEVAAVETEFTDLATQREVARCVQLYRARVCALYVIERVYFRMYCDRVATGQMDISEVSDRMAKALEEANKMLDRAATDEFEAIQKFTEFEHDYEAECRKALGVG